MATTYEAIATVTVGSGGAANIEFTSIPATYTDLSLKMSLRGTVTSTHATLCYNFNGSTSGYSSRVIYGYSGAAGSSSFTTITVGGVVYGRVDDSGIVAASLTASTFSNNEFYIPNYAGSNNKSWSYDFVAGANDASEYVLGLVAGLWSNTSAITSIKILPNAGNFAQYSTATLYGIKNS